MPADVRAFRAVLEKSNNALGWTIARLPFHPATAWSAMVRLRVRGEINGFPFRTSLFPDPARGAGSFFLLVNSAMQREANVSLGNTAAFTLQPDLDVRDATLPEELALQLDNEPDLRAWYDDLSEYTRREIGKWITGVKSDKARVRRACQMAERLLATMEAERELPPALQAAFRSRPRARLGWKKMTPTQRRSELMAVFYYQTPEARQRRLERLCDTAEKHHATIAPAVT